MGDVLIAGGGVAGVATALALQRAGIAATVYEAHPSGGEDAVALAAALAAHRDDPGRAFAAYDAERRPRAEETVAASARLVAGNPG